MSEEPEVEEYYEAEYEPEIDDSYNDYAPQPLVGNYEEEVIEEPAVGSGPYQNCDAVRAAGAAPIYEGDPWFENKFDRDGDGVGCE